MLVVVSLWVFLSRSRRRRTEQPKSISLQRPVVVGVLLDVSRDTSTRTGCQLGDEEAFPPLSLRSNLREGRPWSVMLQGCCRRFRWLADDPGFLGNLLLDDP